MVGQYYWDENGIRKCRRCGKGQSPGHSIMCKGQKTQTEVKEDKKTNKKAEDERYSKQLKEGFALLDRE